MLHRLKQMWIGEPVEFESAYGLDNSVERLRAATSRWIFSALAQEAAVGKVTESRVSLQRVIPMVGNSFKPFFVGHFVQSDGKVKLIGRFTINWFVKIFMAVWFGGIGFFIVGGIVAAIRAPRMTAFPLTAIGMLAFGVGLLYLGAWFSRNEVAWLSDVIRGALSARVSVPSVKSSRNKTALVKERAPGVIAVLSLALALFGIMGCFGAITGIQSARSSANGFMITYFSDATLRYISGAYGAAMFALAYGIYRRQLIAWRAGFVLLGGSYIETAVAVMSADELKGQRWIALIFAAIAFLIMLYWAYWWNAQRVHFHD